VTRHVVFAPEAQADLLRLYDYIAERSTPERALSYTDRIVDYCLGLACG
jgi:toxin ParE1/3/4